MNQKNRSSSTHAALPFLQSYLLYRRMLDGNRYARSLVESSEEGRRLSADSALMKSHMMSVRSFILSLPDCREKMLLYYRYLFGYPMEKCAELLQVSRRTVFRISEEALRFADEYYDEKRNFWG